MKPLLMLGAILTVIVLFTACKSSSEPPVSPTNNTNPSVASFSHKPLEETLMTYVNDEGRVDYAGLKQNRARLDQYLSSIADANPTTFSNDAERLAFWINAYNAHTLADVLDDVYGKAKSVQEVKGFFNKKKHKVAGAELTLDEIEKQGRNFNDPRIHFAVNCASTSCPKLQRFAYTGAELESQMERIAREFMGDSGRGMNYDTRRNVVFLSSIFKWYAADFTGSNSVLARVKAEASGAELLEVAQKYVPSDVAQFLTEKKPRVDYLNYDWSLNAQDNH